MVTKQINKHAEIEPLYQQQTNSWHYKYNKQLNSYQRKTKDVFTIEDKNSLFKLIIAQALSRISA